MEFEGKLTSYKANSLCFEIKEGFDIQEIKRKAIDGKVRLSFYEDGRISVPQRKQIFALFGDIADHTGYTVEEIDSKMRYYFMAETGGDVFSLAHNKVSKEFASRFIEFIIGWCFENDVPFVYREYHVAADISRIFFIYLKYRACFVCGEHHADIAHFETVGMGRNRNKVDKTQFRYMALCRKHHSEQHQTGLDTFMKKYIIVPIKLTADQVKEFGI